MCILTHSSKRETDDRVRRALRADAVHKPQKQ
jgi:hypothetical protein